MTELEQNPESKILDTHGGIQFPGTSASMTVAYIDTGLYNKIT